MTHKRALVIGTSLLILITLITLWASGVFTGMKGDEDTEIPTIDPALQSKAQVSESLDYLIYFKEDADLSEAYTLSWKERGWYVYNALTTQAEVSQAKVRKYLDKKGVSYQSFWIDNVIAVQDSSARTLNGLIKFLEIESVQSVPVITLENPKGSVVEVIADEINPVTLNLQHITADDAWTAGFTGEGFTVGSIDTGVRYTHEALSTHYRGYHEDDSFSHDYNWWDAINGSLVPYDDHGHGSHTTGIMVGADASRVTIGVAPGAQWIACKAIDHNGSGLGWNFLACGQFMLAPWDLDQENDNPSLRPHVINNSWGSCGQTYSNWYEGTVDAWHAAGIYPVFANGNASNCGYDQPPGLNTVGNPARSYHVTSVGSTGTDDGQYASHSTWGPTDSEDVLNGYDHPWLKPQVVAPGVNIMSAISSADDAYAYWGGTSMSAPHVSGLVAIMWQAGDCLVGDYVQTENLIEKSALPIPYDSGNGDEGPENVPNYATGWGEIDVLAAAAEAMIYCSEGDEMLSVSGVISDGGGHGYPLYARIQLESDHHNLVAYTDPFSGAYEVKVYKDVVYDLTLTSEIQGYQMINETQLIFDEQNAVRDYELQVGPDCAAPGYISAKDKLAEAKITPEIVEEVESLDLCILEPGGILAGYVTDIMTGLPVNDATLSRMDNFVESHSTPADPGLSDGFYWAFQEMDELQQTVEVSVSKDFYQTKIVEVSMAQNIVTKKDTTIKHYKDILHEFSMNAWEKISVFLIKYWEIVKNFLLRQWEKVAAFFGMMWERIAQFFINLWEIIAAFFIRMWGLIAVFFVNLWIKISTWFTDFLNLSS